MKYIILHVTLLILFFFSGCSYKNFFADTTEQKELLEKVDIKTLPQSFTQEDWQVVQTMFRENCRTKKAQALYPKICSFLAEHNLTQSFIEENFDVYLLKNSQEDNKGLLTGYYSATLHGSLTKNEQCKYPIYGEPQDLITVELASIYPELKNYRLRGRLVEKKIIPYYERAQEDKIEAPVLCYCDSKIDRFFLEIQGSGKVYLDDNSSLYIGYANQNGHKYRSIGKYMVQQGYLRLEDVSMQSIRQWLQTHPQKVDEVLNYNKSLVFFKIRKQGATGALGVELTPMRSIAIDRRFTKLGSMLYLDADLENGAKISKIVFAQDTGGAIRGNVRADLFTGASDEAMELAGKLKAPLRLWIFLPKVIETENE